MELNIIAAIGVNSELGCNNCLLEHIPEDMKYFREKTKDSIVIMGRKTLESLPKGKPLKGRYNIVVSRGIVTTEGVNVVHSIEEAVKEAQEVSKETGQDIYIIGGASIYRQSIDIVDRMYITHILKEYKEVDCYFPVIGEHWGTTATDMNFDNIDCKTPHIFAIYKRKREVKKEYKEEVKAYV